MKQCGSIGIVRCVVWAVLMVVSSANAEMPLNGVAVYSRFGQEQFMAGLYTPKLTARDTDLLQSDGPGAMELRIIDDRIFPRRFQRMWIEGIAINARDQELESFAPLMAEFSNLLNIQLRRGDLFRIERTPANRILVQLNDFTLGELDDPRFYGLLLRTWIGPVPLSSDFKASLLVAGGIGTAPFQRFLALKPTEERTSQVATALRERRAGLSGPAPPPPTAPEPQPVTAALTQSDLSASTLKPGPDSDAFEAAPEVKAPEDSLKPVDAIAANEPAPPVQPLGSISPDAGGIGSDDVLLSGETGVTVDASTILIEQRYISSLIRRTQSFAKYPRRALKREQEGTVRLTVTLSGTGNVVNIEYEEESRYDYLNKAAREAIESADPFPPTPQELGASQFQFSVPIVFVLQ